MQHPFFAKTAVPRVLAHRGLVPEGQTDIAENSFAAVAAAHAAGAVYVESDCHLTKDDVVVLFHDDTLLRVTGDPRPLSQVTYRELEAIMSERGGAVTLEQALDAFPTTRFNIDVKADDAAVPAGRLVAEHAERVLLTSFSDARRRTALDAAKRVRSDLLPATSAGSGTVGAFIAASLTGSRRLVRRALTGIDALQVPERQGALKIVSPRSIDLAHTCDVEMHVWTVNEPDDMMRLVSAGIDGIVTDRADLALERFHPNV